MNGAQRKARPAWRLQAVHAVLLVQALLSAWVLLRYDGTGDAGDSILHYLYARYAPAHPALYVDHWAKPLFVLLACPFAQAGLVGMKLFNVLCALGSTWGTMRVAERLGLGRPWQAGVALLAMPLNVALTFSGLTEPLFALVLVWSLERAVAGRAGTAALLAGWLPFVRSEGLLFLGVFGLYLLAVRRWRALPVLAVGTVAYAIAGSFVTHDLLWVFTHIPYTRGSYGSGPAFHFVEQLYYVVGLPLYVLVWVGALDRGWGLWRREVGAAEGLLVLGGALLYLAAHSVFWAFGLFHSMGLKRVLVAIAPLLALLAARGLERVAGAHLDPWRRVRTGLRWAVLAYVVIFPFTPNPAALHPAHDLLLTADQRLARTVADRIRQEQPAHGRAVYAAPYLGEVLGLDPFDTAQHAGFDALHHGLRPGDVVIWENWFAVAEGGVQHATLEGDARLRPWFTVEGEDRGRPVTYAVYTVREEVH
ncbi:MAG: hypothetical protein JNL05_13650 [Flavobacteriales bacterium]|nr:hypothetical protein [Flavobacteriales bacterium]